MPTNDILCNQTGSMADVPKDLQAQIHKLEELFSVDTAKLKHITEHFKSELEKGMVRST
jgi:hexokinase